MCEPQGEPSTPLGGVLAKEFALRPQPQVVVPDPCGCVQDWTFEEITLFQGLETLLRVTMAQSGACVKGDASTTDFRQRKISHINVLDLQLLVL